MIAVQVPETTARVELVPLDRLIESPFNPRKTFNEVKLIELADSIREKGVVEPIVVRVRAKHTDRFEIVCGARRFRAAHLAGETQLLAIVRHYTDAQVVEIMAIENGQRDDVPPLEEAAGYKQLLGLDTGYSVAMIAAKIGRTEKFVWDRLKLLDLVDEIQPLLTSGEIGVEHAELIAKLKPTEQRSLLKARGYQGDSGLFVHDGALAFDDDPVTAKKHRKVVSVRELRQHIAEHVRLDVKHAAVAAPLEFGDTARRVDDAMAQPGRGKKVVPVTFSHVCPDGARDPDERTYGATAWKKAENASGDATCDHAVLGVVVAGEQYGRSFKVCIARDRCRTHWGKEIAAREKTATLRASGKRSQADKRQAAEEARERRDREQREKAEARWKPFSAALRTAVHAAAGKQPTKLPPAIYAKVLAFHALPSGTKPADLAKALLVLALRQEFDRHMWNGDEQRYLKWARVLGVDIKACEPKPAPTAEAKKS